VANSALACSMLLLSSCSIFRPDPEEEPAKKDRFEFLRDEQRPESETKPIPAETIEQEQVLPKGGTTAEEARRKFDSLSSSGKKGSSGKTEVPAVKTPPRFYDDFTLLNGDEELSVSLVFNSAPLLDVLPAFADVLGFNFVADSDLKSLITLNLNSKMTRRNSGTPSTRCSTSRRRGEGGGFPPADHALPKLAQQPGARIGNEILYYPLKNSTAKDLVAQLKPFLGAGGVCVELTRPNAMLISDDPANVAKLKQILE
jgi:hypothetical protein